MKSYNKLRREFDKKVVWLQKTCKHKKLSKWMEEWWAIGHSTGNRLKVCVFCNKVIKKESDIKMMISKKKIGGCGKRVHSLTGDCCGDYSLKHDEYYYCDKCAKKLLEDGN